MDTKALWENEYRRNEVPTSTKKGPSKSMEYLAGLLEARNALNGRVIDLGCGTGRNTFYLASFGFEAHGIDIAQNTVDGCILAASAFPEEKRPSFSCSSVSEKLPFPDSYFSLAVCATTIDNFVEPEEFESFASECARTLETDGLLFLYFLTPQDGFYGPLLRDGVADEPATGMRLKMYELKEVTALLDGKFKLEADKVFSFDDIRAGIPYRRNIQAALFKKS